MTVRGITGAVVSVSGLDRALAFYRDVLGLEPRTVGPELVALHGPGGPEVLLHQRRSSSSMAGVALSFAVDDVDATAAAAERCRMPLAWGERQAVLADPDGHVVCLVVPPAP